MLTIFFTSHSSFLAKRWPPGAAVGAGLRTRDFGLFLYLYPPLCIFESGEKGIKLKSCRLLSFIFYSPPLHSRPTSSSLSRSAHLEMTVFPRRWTGCQVVEQQEPRRYSRICLLLAAQMVQRKEQCTCSFSSIQFIYSPLLFSMIYSFAGKVRFISKVGRVEKIVDAHRGAVIDLRWSFDGSALLTGVCVCVSIYMGVLIKVNIYIYLCMLLLKYILWKYSCKYKYVIVYFLSLSNRYQLVNCHCAPMYIQMW